MLEESYTDIFRLQHIRCHVADTLINAGKVAKIENVVEFGWGAGHLLHDKAVDAKHAARNAFHSIFYCWEK